MTMPDLPAVLEIDLTVPGIAIDASGPPAVEITPSDPTVFGVVSPGPAGPIGPAGDGGFTHSQLNAAATWIVSNTLGRNPASITAWIDNELVEPDITVSEDTNTITLSFAFPVTGRAEII